MKKLLFIFGTRPEAIKLAPLIKLIKFSKKFEVKVLVTAQHREMLDQVLRIFDITPDFDLDLMQGNQDLTDITVKVLEGSKRILKSFHPDLVLVHGDTTTTFAAALSAFYHKIDVAHIEAGLRTFNIYSPYPEEMNRLITSRIAKYHFTPTELTSQNLLNEQVSKESILVTGNTVIDALLGVLAKIQGDPNLKAELVLKLKQKLPHFQNRKMILITGHRRENLGSGLENICRAIHRLSLKFPDCDFVYPVHLNPHVQGTVRRILSSSQNIYLIEPLDYLPFVFLMSESYIIITDSGGIQEEAPSLGRPVLVTRDTTERPEAVAAGVVKIVGTNEEVIFQEVSALLENPEAYKKMANGLNPYGDGKSSQKILDFLEREYA